jgi:hypothetical protein
MEALLKWLDNIAGPQYASAVMWTVGALILLVIVLFLIRVARGVSSGTFVAGGRNRRARLAVMDAAAIDNQRRLVLVRRDNVEHLILIGGPTDVVVEQNILPAEALHTPPPMTGVEPAAGPSMRPAPQAASPASERPNAKSRQGTEPVLIPEPLVETPAQRPPEPQAAKPARQEPAFPAEREPRVETPAFAADESAPVRSGSVHFLDKARIAPAPQPTAARPLAPEPSAPEVRAPEPERPAGQAVRLEPAVAAARPETVTMRPEPQADIDRALREELKAPLVGEQKPQPDESSLEDEMKRLLGELSAPARN